MGLESTTTISGLNSANPTSGDPKSQGDDHIRMIKSVLKTTFPLFTGPLPHAHDDIPSKTYVDGLTFASSLPSQAGNGGKFVTTDGTTASWANIPNPQPASTTLSGLVYLATTQEAIDGVNTLHAVTPAGLRSAMTTVWGKRGAVVPTAADIVASLGFNPVSAVYGKTGSVYPTQADLFGSLGISTLSGANTGDETGTTIRAKLGVSTLSGANTGDETTATITSKLSGGLSCNGQIVANNNSLRANGWGGNYSQGVVYFGNANSFIHYVGAGFSLNADGLWTASVTKGGTVAMTSDIPTDYRRAAVSLTGDSVGVSILAVSSGSVSAIDSDVSGGLLTPCNIAGATDGSVRSGTWRCRGACSVTNKATVWEKIA